MAGERLDSEYEAAIEEFARIKQHVHAGDNSEAISGHHVAKAKADGPDDHDVKSNQMREDGRPILAQYRCAAKNDKLTMTQRLELAEESLLRLHRRNKFLEEESERLLGYDVKPKNSIEALFFPIPATRSALIPQERANRGRKREVQSSASGRRGRVRKRAPSKPEDDTAENASDYAAQRHATALVAAMNLKLLQQERELSQCQSEKEILQSSVNRLTEELDRSNKQLQTLLQDFLD